METKENIIKQFGISSGPVKNSKAGSFLKSYRESVAKGFSQEHGVSFKDNIDDIKRFRFVEVCCGVLREYPWQDHGPGSVEHIKTPEKLNAFVKQNQINARVVDSITSVRY